VIYDFKPAINNIKTLINQHKISNELASELIRTIELIKNNKELETFFRKEYQVYNEIEISCKGGRTFRIDRLLVKNNKITLIDYKTGIPKEKDQQQLRDYVSLIKEIGHTVKECFLIYLPELRIEKVVL
jgi:ATP-dependent exoDNAse (exonuclease V) beta subunit